MVDFKGKKYYTQEEFEIIVHSLIENSKREFKEEIKTLKNQKKVYA
ncbi:MAG: hypothetical protein LBF15_03095 [Candidatus Peribacteria bacterium]|jgi:hypothetical protein|nr:hypothetical protein [Candidatus Peribacteria bacterium]